MVSDICVSIVSLVVCLKVQLIYVSVQVIQTWNRAIDLGKYTIPP